MPVLCVWIVFTTTKQNVRNLTFAHRAAVKEGPRTVCTPVLSSLSAPHQVPTMCQTFYCKSHLTPTIMLSATYQHPHFTDGLREKYLCIHVSMKSGEMEAWEGHVVLLYLSCSAFLTSLVSVEVWVQYTTKQQHSTWDGFVGKDQNGHRWLA